MYQSEYSLAARFFEVSAEFLRHAHHIPQMSHYTNAAYIFSVICDLTQPHPTLTPTDDLTDEISAMDTARRCLQVLTQVEITPTSSDTKGKNIIDQSAMEKVIQIITLKAMCTSGQTEEEMKIFIQVSTHTHSPSHSTQ